MDNMDLVAWQVLNIIIAIFPAIILCVYIYKMDVIEKEPLGMLFRLFFLGVIITIPVAYLESVLISTFGITEDSLVGCFILAFVVVALVEEGFKFIVLYFGTWHNRNFNHIYDAIVYAVFISLGFATLENILYVAQPTLKGIIYVITPSIEAVQNGTQTALLRALISVPAHAFYAVASGYYLGLSKFNYAIGNKKKARGLKALAILIPVLLHGFFDFLLLEGSQVFGWLFYCFVTILYIASYFNIKKVSSVEMTINLQKGGIQNEKLVKRQN